MNNNIKNLILLFTISIKIINTGDVNNKGGINNELNKNNNNNNNNNNKFIQIFNAYKFDINSNNGNKRPNYNLIKKYLELEKNNHKTFKFKTGK